MKPHKCKHKGKPFAFNIYFLTEFDLQINYNRFKLTIVSIAISMSISMVGISTVGISIGPGISIAIVSISISVSTTLATSHMLEGVTSWVKLVDTMNSSVVRKTNRNSITVKSITRFSISTTLAKSLGRPGDKGGCVTGVASNTKTMGMETIAIGIRIAIAMAIGEVSWLSISLSTTLAIVTIWTAAKAGG